MALAPLYYGVDKLFIFHQTVCITMYWQDTEERDVSNIRGILKNPKKLCAIKSLTQYML